MPETGSTSRSAISPENDRAYLFLLDFAGRRRIKVWGRARAVEDDPALLERLADPGYRARPERAILFTVEAWDVNCSQHITARYSEAEIADATVLLRNRIADLEAENAASAGRAAPAAHAPTCFGVILAALSHRPASAYVSGKIGGRMNHDQYDDNYIRGILNTVKTIAMVGASNKDNRPSYFAFKYLLERGYNMIPVNPGQAGKELLGRKIYARLADIPEPVDMVDIFRASQYALPIVREALAMNPRPQVIWMQLGVRDDEAAKLAEANGMKVVMNRCPKIEYGRLSSEIAWMGVNTRTLTAKKAKLGGGVQRMALDRTILAGGSTDAATRAERNRDDTP